jgi:prephenate dehydrogenase
MKIGIVGLGLLGGSFALGVKSLGEENHFIGVDINEENAKTALNLGLVDEISTFEKCAGEVDLFVLATPVNVIERQMIDALEHLSNDAILIDLGSTKASFCRIANDHPKRGRYVSCHPIAGTENSGPDAAFAGLLKHKMMIICDKNASDDDALKTVEGLFKSLDMRLSYMNGDEHDRHIAYVSHLSHISSFALGLTVLDKEKDEKSIFAMAGSGFSSTVRLAKSSPAMWAPIFAYNRENVLEALNAYIRQLEQFRSIIEENKVDESYDLMQKANDIRRILMGIDK